MKYPKTKIDYCLWAIGGLVFLSALTKIRLLLGILTYQRSWEQALIIVFFGSAGLAFVGLSRQKIWGVLFVYVYISIATFFFSISLVPFSLGFLNIDVKAPTTLLLVINLSVFGLTAFLHAAKSKSNKNMKEAN